MAISGDYPHPVTVNGFSCRNCSDVDRAKRNIDPANPAGGPFNVNGAKKAGQARFAEAARDKDRLMDMAAQARAVSAASPVAGAYAVAAGALARSGLVNVTA